jgi:hypothetical protein
MTYNQIDKRQEDKQMTYNQIDKRQDDKQMTYNQIEYYPFGIFKYFVFNKQK